MNLTEVLARFLKATRLFGEAQGKTGERRSVSRVRRRIAIKVARSNKRFHEMNAIDFGPEGMRVEPPEQLVRGELLSVQVRRPGLVDGHFVAEVVWCRTRTRDQVLEAGCRFRPRDKAQEETLAHFLLQECQLSLLSPQNRRTNPRVDLQGSQVRLLDGDREVAFGVASNLASGGVLALLPTNLPKGKRYNLDLTLERNKSLVRCEVLVVRSGPSTQVATFEVALAFVNPSAEVSAQVQECLDQLRSEA